MDAMVNHHPDTRFLTDFAAGSLPPSQSLCVSSHLHYCGACRGKVRELSELGSALFSLQHPARVENSEFDRLMSRIERLPPPAVPAGVTTPSAAPRLPRGIEKLTGGRLERMKWRRYGSMFREARLNVGDPARETSLLHIKAGGSAPRHRHQADEITVILQGSFSDQEGKYGVGDFVVRTQDEVHKPVASQDEDCLCLTSLDAPIVLSNWLLRGLMTVAARLRR